MVKSKCFGKTGRNDEFCRGFVEKVEIVAKGMLFGLSVLRQDFDRRKKGEIQLTVILVKYSILANKLTKLLDN